MPKCFELCKDKSEILSIFIDEKGVIFGVYTSIQISNSGNQAGFYNKFGWLEIKDTSEKAFIFAMSNGSNLNKFFVKKRVDRIRHHESKNHICFGGN